MKRLLAVVVGVMFIASSSAIAAAAIQEAKPAPKSTAPAKGERTQRMSGVVTAVSGNSLTIKAASGEVTFTIDSETKVIGRGASTKTREKKAAGEATAIADFLGKGDQVQVTYREAAGAKHAANIRVTKKGT